MLAVPVASATKSGIPFAAEESQPPAPQPPPPQQPPPSGLRARRGTVIAARSPMREAAASSMTIPTAKAKVDESVDAAKAKVDEVKGRFDK